MFGNARPAARGADRAPEKPSGRAAGGSVPPVGRSCNPAIDWPALMRPVARALLGEPNARLSTARELRYGTHGSLAVHVGGEYSGTWRDHEAGEGGGVLALVMRERGGSERDALAWLRDAGLLGAGGYRVDSELAGGDVPSKGRYRPGSALARTPNPPRKPPESRSEPIPGPDDADARRKVARRVWERTEPLPGTIAETYLRHVRGVGHVAGAEALRFHPALSHPYAPGRYPCLVAGVQDVHGDFRGVQRIYLDREGAPRKASVEPVRASLGSLAGGAVRLAEPEHGRPLLVGEGIESTAAAMLLLDVPGWAALGTSGLRAIELPEYVIDVVIAADRDADGAGQLAAVDLTERLESEGRRVRIELPLYGTRPARISRSFVGDWNDVLLLAREAS